MNLSARPALLSRWRPTLLDCLATYERATFSADLNRFAPIVVLRMTAIDASGLHALETLSDRLRNFRRTLVLCGARHQPAAFLERAEFREHVGRDNIQPHVHAAIARAREIWAARSATEDMSTTT